MPVLLLWRIGLDLSHSLSLSLGLRFPPGLFFSLQGALSFLGLFDPVFNFSGFILPPGLLTDSAIESLFDPVFNFPGFVLPPGLLTDSAIESASELFCLGDIETSAQFLEMKIKCKLVNDGDVCLLCVGE